VSVTTMKLQLFTESAVGSLVRALGNTRTPDEFFAAVDVVSTDDSNILLLDWNFVGAPPVLTYDRSIVKSARLGQDIENAISLHKYLGPIAPAAATDFRLWTHLSVGPFADYSNDRWPLEGKKWTSRGADRWIMSRSGRGQLVRNSISRLWWAANLTFDPRCSYPLSKLESDPYAYLRVLLRKEDAFLAIVDRDVGMVPDLLFAVLDHLNQDSKHSREGYVRELMKEVVLMSGYSELSSLTYSQLLETLSRIGKTIT